MSNLIPSERIESKIFIIRGQKVIFDRDLAELYGVETRILSQVVKRNKSRFPMDFMFQLSKKEFEIWRSQIVISNSDKMGLRWRPFAFTEQGVAMLSGLLNSKTAIRVNIAIMRAFVKLRQILSTHKELAHKLNELENKFEKHDVEIHTIFEAIRKIMCPPEKPNKKIGFITDIKGRRK
ncbi:MAG: ORF6N domain-containing protein [Candidatus Margulisbacteria bacterium]|nr:ORF6N domain-containing protein [Candidatus Margulisiibacteriota bacterium]MBU1022207.1 ORF6N domain-containing protein [Candidatus Margulisiibacteriota bacterium]MBU1729354.1 ORF6N domain-containing protein [Candidatus Margulisiibacteriota bacterium]MBU1955627.1 ORF6N domain-containing protein [Candidatus Margulisiibacteriota bacterium]